MLSFGVNVQAAIELHNSVPPYWPELQELSTPAMETKQVGLIEDDERCAQKEYKLSCLRQTVFFSAYVRHYQ
jgi:hypothetical protein